MENITGISTEKKLQILLEWERLYTDALLDALKPSGDVLEIGFGSGYAANSIQSFHPKSHTIIETNAQKAHEASPLKNKNPSITVIGEDWQTALPKLKSFDTIFFHDYPIENEMQILKYLFQEDTEIAASQAKELLGQLEEQMSTLKMQFSDSEIEDFFQKLGRFNSTELPIFFRKLQVNGNITKQQYESLQKKHNFESAPYKNVASTQADPMLICLEECLKSHMGPGARFTAILNTQVSKYDNAAFFETVITNPAYDYTEKSVTLKLDDKPRNALIMLVKKH